MWAICGVYVAYIWAICGGYVCRVHEGRCRVDVGCMRFRLTGTQAVYGILGVYVGYRYMWGNMGVTPYGQDPRAWGGSIHPHNETACERACPQCSSLKPR